MLAKAVSVIADHPLAVLCNQNLPPLKRDHIHPTPFLRPQWILYLASAPRIVFDRPYKTYNALETNDKHKAGPHICGGDDSDSC